jgi:hypothetical protein
MEQFSDLTGRIYAHHAMPKDLKRGLAVSSNNLQNLIDFLAPAALPAHYKHHANLNI